MIQIAPSILSCDPSLFRPAVVEMIKAGVDWIHFDVMDGQFVPPITFGADLVRSLRGIADTPFEAHLMTESPEKHIEAFVAAGCQRVIFHVEATHHSHRLIQSLRASGVQAGIAINPGTPISAIEPVLLDIDLALVMTVNPGWGGQAFIASTLDKVRQLRQLRPDLDIEVDGGVDSLTVCEAYKAGANVFVTGSYLMRQPTIETGVRVLRESCA